MAKKSIIYSSVSNNKPVLTREGDTYYTSPKISNRDTRVEVARQLLKNEFSIIIFEAVYQTDKFISMIDLVDKVVNDLDLYKLELKLTESHILSDIINSMISRINMEISILDDKSSTKVKVDKDEIDSLSSKILSVLNCK